MNKKFLLIRLSSMGDVIHLIPLANALKQAGYELTWLVCEKGFDLLKNNPCVDNVILAPTQKWKKEGFSLKNFVEYLKILHQIRKEHFDIALDLQMRFKSLYWMLFCGAKRKVRITGAKEGAQFAAKEVIENIFNDQNISKIKGYMKISTYFGGNENINVTLPERSNEIKEKVNDLLSTLDKTKPIVVIAPATTWISKHWNKDYWKEVVENLKDKYSLVFTGGKNDNELISYISENKFLNLAGKTNLLELTEVLSRADIVICPESGTVHLAWAVQKPAVITIFTSTPLNFFAPVGENCVSAIGNLPCQPCCNKTCQFGHYDCTKLPKPQEIINIVNKLSENKTYSV